MNEVLIVYIYIYIGSQRHLWFYQKSDLQSVWGDKIGLYGNSLQYQFFMSLSLLEMLFGWDQMAFYSGVELMHLVLERKAWLRQAISVGTGRGSRREGGKRLVGKCNPWEARNSLWFQIDWFFFSKRTKLKEKSIWNRCTKQTTISIFVHLVTLNSWRFLPTCEM